MREREAGDLLGIAESMDEQNISNNENTMERDGRGDMSDQLLGGESATPNNNRAGNMNEDCEIPSICNNVDIKGSVEKALKYMRRTVIEGQPHSHQIPVCVICDRFIIGVEEICSIKRETIEEHHVRLGVKQYETHYARKLPEELILQYTLPGLEGILLSPRARKQEHFALDGLEEISYEACSTCARALTPKKIKSSPPKFAIANGFAIGSIPPVISIKTAHDEVQEISVNEHNVSDLLCATLSPVRPHGYVFAYSGGSQSSIQGHFSFFEMDQSHMGGVMNYFQHTGANPNIYCVLCGRMTPNQKRIVRERSLLDTSMYIALVTWFIQKSGHNAFRNFTPPRECPQPTLIEDNATDNNTDEQVDTAIENQFDGGTFYFSSRNEPDSNIGTYNSSSRFAFAMMNNTAPTLLVHGGNYANERSLNLEDVFPVQFPFGFGGPNNSRRNRISQEVCLQHYLKLSLPQFMRGNFILVVNHIYNRILSFKSGIIKAKSNFRGSTLAEKVSTLTVADIEQAVAKKKLNQTDPSNAGMFLKAISTSCRNMGHTEEAAKYNRRNFYALDDHFGLSSVFLSVTPDDECSFRVRLFAKAGEQVGFLI